MPPAEQDTRQQIEAYLEADGLYSIVPIPAPLDVAVALEVCLPKIEPKTSEEELSRLSRLVVFHDLRPTAGAWDTLLQRLGDVPKSAAAIIALAWLGDEEQRLRAAAHYRNWLERADPDRDRPLAAEVCAALGPSVGTVDLKAWAEKAAENLARGNPGRNDELRMEMIRQFANLDIPEIERDFEVRAEIEKDGAIGRLAEIYCDAAPESHSAMIWWSAVTLNRLAKDAETRKEIVERFAAIARQHARAGEGEQEEADGIREAALRAASFFGFEPPMPDRIWLADREDHGALLLVLRPNWEYPAPHSHNH